MAGASDVVRIAAAEIGVTEYPSGSNKVKYAEWYGMNGQPWCAMFVSWVFAQANLLNACGGKFAYCPYWVNYAKEHNMWLDREEKPQAGDIIFFSNESRACHVGIVEKRIDSTYVQTIEGNTSVTSNDNGGAVMRRTRTYGKVGSSWYILGFMRPNYSNSGNGGVTAPGNSGGSTSNVNEGTGTYTVTASELCVRTGPGTNYRVKNHSELTADGQAHDANRDGAISKGTRVTVSQTTVVDGDTWGKIPSGWICLCYNGNVYAVKDGSSSGGSSSSSSGFSNGTYTITASALNVRTGAGTNYRKKSKSELTADGQKHSNANGALLNGTRVTVSQVVSSGNYVWGKIPSGWICLRENGANYVK